MTAVINVGDYEKLINNQFTYLTTGLLKEKFTYFLKKINKTNKYNSMIKVQHFELFSIIIVIINLLLTSHFFDFTMIMLVK